MFRDALASASQNPPRLLDIAQIVSEQILYEQIQIQTS